MLARLQCLRLSPRSLVRQSSTKATRERLANIVQNGNNWLFSWAIHDVFASSKAPLPLNHLIHGLRSYPSPYLCKALERSKPEELAGNPTALCHLMSRAVSHSNLELALQYLRELRVREYPVPREVAALLISLAASCKQARLAIDIAEWYAATHPEVSLGKKVWLDCLVAAAFLRYDQGVVDCWAHIEKGGDVSVSEQIRVEVSMAKAAVAAAVDV